VDAITNIPRDCGLGCAGVNDTLITVDWYLDVLLVESTPVLLYQGDESFEDDVWYILADVEVFSKVTAVALWVEFDFDEFGGTVFVR
jgi:hypothetical protein